MARAPKQPKIEEPDSSESEHSDMEEEDVPEETIDVDFDVKEPDPSDFHGIKTLLHQMFLKAHLDTSELANIIISQKDITSVMKQDQDSDMEDEDDDDVFGVTTVINLGEQEVKCTNEIFNYILTHIKESSVTHQKPDSSLDQKSAIKMLEKARKEKKVGLIINERMINIPASSSLPLYQRLKSDIEEAKAKGSAFNFDLYLLLCKTVVFPEQKMNAGVNPRMAELPVVFANAEEEIIEKCADVSFEFSVKADADTGLDGKWTDEDCEGERRRRLLFLSTAALDKAIIELEMEFKI